MSEERIAESKPEERQRRQPQSVPDNPKIVNDPERLRRAQLRRVNRRLRTKGEVLLPCVPALLDDYVARLSTIFSALGKPFSASEVAELRRLTGQQLDKGFAKSALNQLKVSWWSDDSKDLLVHYRIQIIERSKTGQYEYWVKSRQQPLFGAHPDAFLMEFAARLPKDARIADLGAGTGRNALPLAAAGYRVDAVDATESFVETIRREAAARELSDRISATRGDILAEQEVLPAGAFRLVLLSQVLPDLRQLSDARKVFRRADHLLAPGGFLLFNCFVCAPGYQPDSITRELSQFAWSWLLTREELDGCRRGFPFDLVVDEDAHEYERARLPEWPPTGWYSHWARGNDLFGLAQGEVPPAGLRWLAYRKRG